MEPVYPPPRHGDGCLLQRKPTEMSEIAGHINIDFLRRLGGD